VEQSPSSEASSHRDGQEISSILWNLKFHYRVHKSPPLYPEPYESVHTITPLTLSSHLRLGLPSGLFPSYFLTEVLHIFLFTPMRELVNTHLIFLDLIVKNKFIKYLCTFGVRISTLVLLICKIVSTHSLGDFCGQQKMISYSTKP